MNILKLYNSHNTSFKTIDKTIESYINKDFVVYHLNPAFNSLSPIFTDNRKKFGNKYHNLNIDDLSLIPFGQEDKKVLIIDNIYFLKSFLEYILYFNNHYIASSNLYKELKEISIKNNVVVICNSYLSDVKQFDLNYIKNKSKEEIIFDYFDNIDFTFKLNSESNIETIVLK